MLNNFIYAKQKSLFEEALNNGEVSDESIVFIEDTKEIWNHGTYFDGNTYLQEEQYKGTVATVNAEGDLEIPETEVQVKDAVDTETNEKIYIRNHAMATYMSDGRTVEEAIATSGGGNVDLSELEYYLEGISDILDYINDETEMQEAIDLANQINGL